ncbi:MAG: hypothetical protein RBS07_05235 [Lentimicrobium sp.]|nr:hypothetical protein [Lentimicrobium sp.]
MKINILTTTGLFVSILVFTLSTSCNQSSGDKEVNNVDSLNKSMDGQQISQGEEWLKSIFQCDNGNDYCFPDEQKITTTRYYEFFTESLDIYEYPDFETDTERIAAENAFKMRWGKIYPLDVPILSPFGRGNGIESGQKLENVTIAAQSDMKYSVIIDYGDGIQTTSEVTLIANGSSFLVDFMISEFID